MPFAAQSTEVCYPFFPFKSDGAFPTQHYFKRSGEFRLSRKRVSL
ncbi:MAG: hypothetical protein ACI9TZ_003293 [Yoonia sp.]|jgi:hypothetical protein